MQQSQKTPVVMLIGQSGAGKSKFISEFLHEKVKGFVPKRKDGQTTKCMTVYRIKHNSDEMVDYTINFASESVVREIFKEKLINAIKSISDYEDEIAATSEVLKANDYNYEHFKMSKYNNREDEKNVFLDHLYEDNDNLFDLNKLLKKNHILNIEEVNEFIYSQAKCTNLEDVLDYMIERLYKSSLESIFNVKESEFIYKNQINLEEFSRKDMRLIETLEPVIKSIEFSIPCNSEYCDLLFNNENSGIIFLDTVGTDHTGEDNLETIFGIYNLNTGFSFKPDIITFINDINKFRGREKAIKSIFNKIINDNNLSKFILVNTKIDKRTTSGAFQEIKNDYEENEEIDKNSINEFRIHEKEVIKEINNFLFNGLEKAVEEYLIKKSINLDLKEKILRKIKTRCELNSVYLSNPETDTKFYSEITPEIDVKILEKISMYSFKEEIRKYINKVYENYKVVNNVNQVFINKKNKNSKLFYFTDTEKFECFVDELILQYIKSYEKLRFSYYNSMRALSNGFARKQFMAESSYYSKSFPNIEFLTILKDNIKNAKSDSFYHKNYEVDFNKIKNDNLIFNDIDPIVNEKLLSQFDYLDFYNIVWKPIQEKLIELNQFGFTKSIDSSWGKISNNDIMNAFRNYYVKNNLISIIKEFQYENTRWKFMGNIIGYQFKCIFNLNRSYFKLKLMEFIKLGFEKVNGLVDKEIMITDSTKDELTKNSLRKINNSENITITKQENELAIDSIQENSRTEKVAREDEYNMQEKSKVFIVHGHDEATARRVKEFIKEDLNMEAIILMDEVNIGLTIPEKFEQYARECDYAIILMTPDDKLKYDGSNETIFRARQNVILELGYFWAKFDRKNFVVLKKGNIEKPSDIQGVVYLEFINTVEETFYKLQKEITIALKV